MMANSILTIPVLLTAIGISVPTIGFGGTIQIVSAIDWIFFVLAVGVAFVTNWTVSTCNILWKIATVVNWIVLGRFRIDISIGTEKMLSFRVFVETMPESSAVEFVGVPPWTQLLAVDVLVVRNAVLRGCRSGLTVHVAVVTDRSSSALGILWEVAAVVGQVIHRGFWVVMAVRTSDVVRCVRSFDTVPELSAVVLIRIVSWAHLFAVDPLVLRGTIGLLGGCGRRGRTMDIPWRTRTVPAVNVLGIGAPCLCGVKLLVTRTGLMSHATLLALVVLEAGIWVGDLDIIVLAAHRSVRKSVIALLL